MPWIRPFEAKMSSMYSVFENVRASSYLMKHYWKANWKVFARSI